MADPTAPSATAASTPRIPGPWTVALAGAVTLAVAMGLGRFAFTPLLPMMLADGVIDLNAASWLASANYLGYLAGAVLCMAMPWIVARVRWLPAVNGPWLVRFGLVATGVLTLGMVLPWPSAWPTLRFAAGVASALVFVHSSGWCLAELARRGQSAIGGAMYTGPGVGIVLSGLFASAMVSWHWRAATGWLIFGVLAFVLSATVWRIVRSHAEQPSAGARTGAPVGPPVGAPTLSANAQATAPVTDASAAARATAAQAHAATAAAPPLHGSAEVGCLAFAYGLAGFGYIITATFLPVIARTALPGSPWLDLFWPIFGCGVITGALLATRLRLGGDLRRPLAVAYFVQALGVATSLWSPTLAGFAAGSLLLGLPFTMITFFAMQEVRRLRPASTAATMGLLTATYGIGQIIGPPLAARLLRSTGDARPDFTLSLQLAAGTLLLGAAIYLGMRRVWARG